MDSEVVDLLSLKWNNHRSTFLNVLFNLCLKECHSDATIICQGEHFPAHKLVLATCSDFFKQIFNKTKCKHPFIIVNELKPKDLEALLNFMYRGEVNVPQDSLTSLIKAAEILSIKGLAVPDETIESDKSISEERKKGSKRSSSPSSKRRKMALEVDNNDEKEKKSLLSENSSYGTTSMSLGNNSAESFDNQKFELKVQVPLIDIKEEPVVGSNEPILLMESQSYYDKVTDQSELNDNIYRTNCDLQLASVSPPTCHDLASGRITFASTEGFAGSGSVRATGDISQMLSPAYDFDDPHQMGFAVSNSSSSKKEFRCKFCPYLCYNRTHAIYHLRKHTGEKPYMCKICFKQFSMKHNRDRHMVNTHGNEHFSQSEPAAGSGIII